jgi:hypothetical protein
VICGVRFEPKRADWQGARRENAGRIRRMRYASQSNREISKATTRVSDGWHRRYRM